MFMQNAEIGLICNLLYSRGKEKTISEHLDCAVKKMVEINNFRAELCKFLDNFIVAAFLLIL